MIRFRPLALALAVTVPLAACDGFKEAMTAHVDVAARAGSQELSVTRLAELLGNSTVPLRKEVAQAVADAWVTYQLLGYAAAHGDSLNDPKLIDEAMWAAYANSRINKLAETIRQRMAQGADTVNLAARYAQGDLLSARHILVPVPQGAPAATVDSLQRVAQGIRGRVTSANFAQVADQTNQPGAGGPGGALPPAPAGSYVPEFENALRALRPGDISDVVRSQFGFHIIRRSTYDEVKTEFDEAMKGRLQTSGDSVYLSGLDAASKVEIRQNAPALMKALAREPEEHADDGSVLATSTAGNFTVARAARWISGFPNPEQARQQILQAPDSALPQLVKSLIRQEMLVRQADSAKVTLDSNEVRDIRRAFVAVVSNAWSGLGVTPKALADSAKTEADRERLAATRVDAYMDQLIRQNAQFVQVPPPVAEALRDRYDAKVNQAGLDRAVERAQVIRAGADSARAAATPPSAVPLPGGQPQGQPQQPQQPQPQGQPQGATKRP